MIKKIDWYILKKFISTAVFMVLIFSVIAVAIDTSEKADDFVKSGLSTSQIIMQYYLGFVPFIISMIFPLMVFIAVIFFTSKMAGKSELIAILAGGVRFNRMLRPYFLGALFLGGLFWVATQYWMPKANVLRANFQATYIDSKSSYEQGEAAKRTRNYYFRVDAHTFAGMRNYDTASKSANDFYMDRLDGYKMTYNLRADYLKWDTAKKTWKLQNVVERKIEGAKEITKIIPEMTLNINLKPSEIKFDKYLKDKMTTPELRRYIKSEESRGAEGLNDYKVERYRRDANPASIFILTLIGVSVSARKTRGGSGTNLAIGIIAAAFFVVMDKFSLTFSTKGNFPPMLAAWMPNIIFSFFAVWMYRTAPK